MSRKDFQLIADVVKQIEDADVRLGTVYKFVVALRATNPRFNKNRFLDACNA